MHTFTPFIIVCLSRKDKEMSNFISLLDTTLKMNVKEEEEEDRIEVEESPAIPEPPKPVPAGITYTKSSPSLGG